MPTYGGGKAKIGKDIFFGIKEYENEIGWVSKNYFEPFCGLLGVGIHFVNDDEKRNLYFTDINEDIILMWQDLIDGWSPPKKCSKEKYEKEKRSKKHSSTRGFVGIACAYSGIFFAGYREKAKSSGQDFFKNMRDGIIKMKKDIINSSNNVEFIEASDYSCFSPKGMTIYCDPPYKNNKFRSEHFDNFDHDQFWDIMREWSKNNLVFISEYTAPKDFKPIWKMKMNSTYNSTKKKRIEKLFVFME